MALDEGTNEEARLQAALKPVAVQTLEHFETTASAAKAELARGDEGAGALINANSMASDKAARNMAEIRESRRQDLTVLASEPAIARLVIVDENDQRETIFIVRASPMARSGAGPITASYRSVIGRLGSLNVGEDATVQLGDTLKTYEIVERATLSPRVDAGEWDARDTVFTSQEAGPVTVTSLRALLRALTGDEGLDEFDRMLRAEEASKLIVDGVVREVIGKMGLRDRPLLDRYQDEIFRLPINSRLAIMGPPGTGKTTTLIKRLGQKLDPDHLLDDERAVISRTADGLAGLRQSWLMFTPTDLLKQYVKEAFNRESIPAPDQRIRTWSEERRELGRRRLGVLRSTSSRGAILREELQSLRPETIENQIEWFEDFQSWQSKDFWSGLERSAAQLREADDTEVAGLGRRVEQAVTIAQGPLRAAPFLALAELRAELGARVAALKGQLDFALRKAFSARLQTDKELHTALLRFAENLSDAMDAADDPDGEDDEDEEEAAPRGGLAEAFEIYTRATRAQARAAVLKRSVGRRTRNGRILEWLGERALSDTEAQSIGAMAVDLAALRRFANPLSHYIERMPARYRRFRRERQAEGRWYVEAALAPNDLAPLEVDLLILAMLGAGRALLGDPRIRALAEEPRFTILRTVRELFRVQVVVDEATDFSPLQLACMSQLADPATDAFVVCGDFNQRITAWGSRSEEDLRWVHSDIDLRPIIRSYRHSRQLSELAAHLTRRHGMAPTNAQPPEGMATEGFAPVVGRELQGDVLIKWLAARIQEIDARMSGELPSVAVLVNEEALVTPIAAALKQALADTNIQVQACVDGQVKGQDENVRVFDIQHIKGLEFEAVFFVGLDDLARLHPDLFDKYLYVGATRAATYLGLTVAGEALPGGLEDLSESFAADWS